MSKWTYQVFWYEPDQGYIATCAELPTLSAWGETAEDALRELEVVITASLEVYRKEGWPIPEPASSPEHSGKFVVRVPRTLHARLAQQAEAEGVSLNTLSVAYLAQGVAAGHPAVAPGQEAPARRAANR